MNARLVPWLLLLSCLLPACDSDDPARDGSLTVMTRNLYLGSDFTSLLLLGSPEQVPAEVAEFWDAVVASDIPGRMQLVADEIVAAQADVVALQEVELFRTQSPSDFDLEAPVINAETVAYDFLALLEEALAARGQRYTVAVEHVLTDAELPAAQGGGLVDVRMTDRDVLLVREELATRSPLTHVFASNLPVLQIGGKVPTAVKRGYLSAVVESDLGALRIVDSHLEVGGPAAPIQELQADELVTALGSESPLLVLGDFNSAADNSSTASYGKLTAALSDAWTLSGTAETGHTCCSGLTDATFTADERIDLVLLRGLAVEAVAVTGIEARTATGRFAADHAGVVATVRSAE